MAIAAQATVATCNRSRPPLAPMRSRVVGAAKDTTFTLPAVPNSPWLLPRLAAQAALTTWLRAMPHRLADYG